MDVAPHGMGVSPDVNRPASVVSDRYGCMGRSLHQLRELIVDTDRRRRLMPIGSAMFQGPWHALVELGGRIEL